jgi:hypothetical protein
MTPSGRHNWSRLNKLQRGKYAEYVVKMEFVLCGCDVFSSEVDDHGIDFVVRTHSGSHYDVQVKSFSLKAGTPPYVFLPKQKLSSGWCAPAAAKALPTTFLKAGITKVRQVTLSGD